MVRVLNAHTTQRAENVRLPHSRAMMTQDRLRGEITLSYAALGLRSASEGAYASSQARGDR